MTDNEENGPVEIWVDFGYHVVVPLVEDFDDYDDNYLRMQRGSLILLRNDGKTEQIGEIAVWHIDGARAIDNGLDIVDVCDSISQDAYEYAVSVYTDGELDRDILGEDMIVSEDVLVLHSIAILRAYRGRGYGLAISRKLIETIGHGCGAVLLRPAPLQFSRAEDTEWLEKMQMPEFTQDQKAAADRLFRYWMRLRLRRTKHPEIYCVI
jgi:GNAT superfamily N-acetyltransferase